MISNLKSKIYISGHKGMVGTAVLKTLKKRGYRNLIYRTKKELDLTNSVQVESFLKKEKPEIVINAAAKVGGILSNSLNQFQFLMHNMLMQNNLINSSLKNNVETFIFLGSSCIYPKFSPQPISEKNLLGGFLEKTNEGYALAKISGVKSCQAINSQFMKQYISLMPTNLYGPYDNFDLQSSHVIPAMIRKFHEGKINNKNTVKLWGSGNPSREFLYVEDLAEAIIFIINNPPNESLYNVGTGVEVTVKELANKIKEVVNYKGKIEWDQKMPDGTPRKLLDSSKIKKLGWKSSIDLDKGLNLTYNWYLNNINNYKKNKL